MDMIDNLILGVHVAFSPDNILYAFVGVLLGNFIGILPGIGALAAISMLLPVTYGLDPTGSMMMLGGLYYGTSFGGATASILLNIPGTPAHAVTCLDGHPLALKGRAGPAIFMAMIASFIGVCLAIVIMTTLSSTIAKVAFQFESAEYFSLMVMGLIAASTLSTGSPVRAIAAMVIGLLVGVIGTDVQTGVLRFTFGLQGLWDGVSLVVFALALFGVADLFRTVGHVGSGVRKSKYRVRNRDVRPSKGDLRRSAGSITRGSLLGAFIGALPGAGASIASFMAYALERNVSRTPGQFGKGAIEGVAGPEAANSSAEITAFIPTLTLGIPGSATMALMLAALIIHDITPGPRIVVDHPELFWGLLVSFWIGNFMLLLLNIPLIRMWVKMLEIPYRLVYPFVLFLVIVAVYAANYNMLDIIVVTVLGMLSFIAASLKIPPAPAILGFVLGPMMEENFRRTLLIYNGDIGVFLARPISGSFLAISLLILIWVIYREARNHGAPSVARGA